MLARGAEAASNFASEATSHAKRAAWLSPAPIACVLATIALASWARLTILPQVFVQGLVLPAFPDVYYHIRRIGLTLESFPRVPVMDPFLNWPEGGPCPWPIGFDLLGALYVMAVGGSSSPEAAARAVAGFPIVLGLCVVLLTMALAWQLVSSDRPRDPLREHRDIASVVAAGAIAAVLPQAVVISQLGSVDHHVAETLAMALLAGWVLWAARASERASEPSRGAWLRFEIAGAAIALFAGAVFNGSILYVAIACGALIALRLAEPHRRAGLLLGSGFPAIALAGLGLAALNQAAVAEHGHALDFRFPSHLQPLLHGVAALGCLAAALAARSIGGEQQPLRRFGLRLAVLAAASAALLGLGWLFARSASQELANGLTEWLWRSDPWLAGINEFQPLFPTAALFRPAAWQRLWEIHGVFGVAAPVLLPLGLSAAVRAKLATGACFALMTLALVVLTLIQTRFGRVLTPHLAISSALALCWLAQSASRSIRLPAAASLATLVVLFSLSDPAIRASLRWRDAREPSALEAASLFLRELDEPRAHPRGVLTKWDYGHTVLSVGERPVVAAGFGPWPGEQGFHDVMRSLQGDEPALVELMRRRELDYLVTGLYAFLPSTHVADPDAEPPFWVSPGDGRVELNPGFFADRPLSALILGGTGLPTVDVAHAAHMRPRFVSPQRIPGLGTAPIFQFWVYERVAGARLRGTATPGARVVARTQLTMRGAPQRYEAWTDARADGRFELVIALPSGSTNESLSVAEHYEIAIDGRVVASVPVSEQTVSDGAVMEIAVQPHGGHLAERTPQ